MKLWGYPGKSIILVSLGICIIYHYFLLAGIWPCDVPTVPFKNILAMRDTRISVMVPSRSLEEGQL